MAIVTLHHPASGERQTLSCVPGNQFVFDFPMAEALVSRDGDRLVLTFEDGSSIVLEDFYTVYTKDSMPDFVVDGSEVSGTDFFTALNQEDLMPAAGPSASASSAKGARFHEFSDADLVSGVDRLGGLDLSSNRAFDAELNEWAAGPLAEDNGVLLTPGNPGAPDASIPIFRDPSRPSTSVATGERDMIMVNESDLKQGEVIVSGSMTVSAPDGIATITIGGVTVYENGAFVEGVVIPTDEGFLRVDGFDPSTGELTYSFVMTESSKEHSSEGKDSIGHEFDVVVTDTDGSVGTGTITTVIQDDVPTAVEDRVSMNESDGTLTGDVLGNDDFGADGPQDGRTVTWNVDENSPDVTRNPDGSYTVVTENGVATLNPDGTYSYELTKDVRPGDSIAATARSLWS